ncbi:MAG TPA: hypothetical protein VLG74_11335 [Blastocatellia bacterium]|nr:hypothetical protein [Blastocatellia bacterium]
MNAGMSLIAIVALLLALAAAGGAAKEQAGVNSSGDTPIAPSKIAINHNETLVSDTTPIQ